MTTPFFVKVTKEEQLLLSYGFLFNYLMLFLYKYINSFIMLLTVN